MADIKISELPVASSLTGTELVPVVQGGATKQITTQDIADLGAYNITLGQEFVLPYTLGGKPVYRRVITSANNTQLSVSIPSLGLVFDASIVVGGEEYGAEADNLFVRRDTGGVYLATFDGNVQNYGYPVTWSFSYTKTTD